MSFSWFNRKARLGVLLKSRGDEDEDALVLDNLLAQNSVRKTTTQVTAEVENLRFQDRDLQIVGTLEFGQFGVIDVVTCNLDGRVYVRKSIEKRLALRMRHQCSPRFERDILLSALKTKSCWAPHLLCAFQTSTHLNIVMDYADGGSLWDVLESSPDDGKISETDLRWWVPQVVSAIHWCHSQGFAHRDIKPHNFVLASNAHVLLIDFGSSAPLLPPRPDGSQQIEKRYCLLLCGTCDYISPEVLCANEEALVALEMEDEEKDASKDESEEGGYGLETDWWSLGSMLYEMAYGITPFFAKDIRQTYLRIMNHKSSLRFDSSVPISSAYKDLLSRLLTTCENRIGRKNVNEIMGHSFFVGIDWQALPDQRPPESLHLPQFSYAEPVVNAQEVAQQPLEESHSQPFEFSALFQSSLATSPGQSTFHSTPSQRLNRSTTQEDSLSSFIGFSWGPTENAFINPISSHDRHADILTTPRPSKAPISLFTPKPLLKPPGPTSALGSHFHQFSTPIRSTSLTPHLTLTRTSSRRTDSRRPLSDHQAMKQLTDCVGMSARKKVLESGRKPRILKSISRTNSWKELRFHSSSVSDGIKSDKVAPSNLVPESSGSEETDMDCPPSPSPSPRPTSAMSISRRSGTSTVASVHSRRTSLGMVQSASDPLESVRSGSNHMESQEKTHTKRRGMSLDDLEEKHTLLMRDIIDIEQRLGDFSMLVGGR